MNYGSQSSVDPWSWDLGDEHGANDGNKMQFGNTGSSWSHVTPTQNPHPSQTASIPQVTGYHQQPTQEYYNDPSIFPPAPKNKSGAEFFEGFVGNNSNSTNNWAGQNYSWNPQSQFQRHPNPISSSHGLPHPSRLAEAENNEIAPPDKDYKQVAFTGAVPNILPEKNGNAVAVKDASNNSSYQFFSQPQPDVSGPVEGSNGQYGAASPRWGEGMPSNNYVQPQVIAQSRDYGQHPNHDNGRNQNAQKHQHFSHQPVNNLDVYINNTQNRGSELQVNNVSSHPTEESRIPNPIIHADALSDNNERLPNVYSSSDSRSAKNLNQNVGHLQPSVFSQRKVQSQSPTNLVLDDFENRASPLETSSKSRSQDNTKTNSENTGDNPLYHTPDTKNNNPFITTNIMEKISAPMGSSTPTGLPYKPENEEVPSKPDSLHEQMKTLTVEDNTLSSHFLSNPAPPTRDGSSEKDIPILVSDRNQYLETGHLSAPKENDESTNQDIVDEGDAPPPGLDRMVTGQLREPITTPLDLEIQSMTSNAPTIGSCRMGESSNSSILSEGDGPKNGSAEGLDDEPESQRLVQGESTADDQYLPGPTGHREIPGEAEPMRGRVVVGQMGRGPTPPMLQDQPSPRSDRDRGEREIVGRMVVGERTEPPQSNIQEDYRQPHRPRHRHPRGESSFDEEDRDYSSDRDRRDRERGDYKRDERPRRRRDDRHRSPEFRSDEEYEDKRPYPRGNRERDRRDRRDRERERDYSPERDYYYRDYYEPRDRRPRRYDREREYHHRERDYDDDHYYRDHRSRPSSRTGSDYRRLNVSNDFQNRSRHYYPDSSALMNSSMSSTGFPDFSKVDPRAYGEYLETMRRVDPAGYALWYNNYMATRYGMHQSGSFNNDRASVHSGQSSTNQRQATQSPLAVPDDDKEEDYTPRLYTTAHVRGTIDNYGRLVIVDPNYPIDGQRASVSLYSLTSVPIPDADMEEFIETPGPFIPGITHRSTVLHYLKRMSQTSQKNSEKLLYDLVHLIVKGNGEINGCDISELLMNSFKKCTYDDEKLELKGTGSISQYEVVSHYRELLIQGNKLEAIEWAMEKGAWGHALFLSSKMDAKTHKDVMFRFVDSISQNDPIRTLYQMMSGHIPHASECCGDKQWSDWRPHLAMILGNPTENTKIDRKSIIRLGDSLYAKGRIFAAHFCYISAQVEVSACKPSAKLGLLGSSLKFDNPHLASCRSIMLTLCYEYGLKLKQSDFSIPSLQVYKMILTSRLIDIGRNKVALQYCQLMALEALQCGNYDRSIMCQVIDLASRLKMLEPSLALSGDVNFEPEWLEKLKIHYDSLPDDYDAKVELRPSASSSTISEVGQDAGTDPLPPPLFQARNLTFPQPVYDPYVAYNPELTVTSDLQPKTYLPSSQPLIVNEEQDYNSGIVMSSSLAPNPYSEPPNVLSSSNVGVYGPEQPYWDNNSNMGPTGLENNLANNYPDLSHNPEAPSTPVKSVSNDFFKASEEQLKLGEVANEGSKPKENQQHQQSLKNDDQKSGWFGGFLGKLSMRPKNQMKLPDDKNPSIVWDKEKKKWVNLDGETEATNQIKPPPKTFDFSNSVQQPQQQQPMMQQQPAPGGPFNPSFNAGTSLQNQGPSSLPPLSSNKYKIQKGKLMKKNYVDIMSSNKEGGQSQPSSLDNYMPLVPQVPSQPTYFTPPQVEGIENTPYDFITPASNNPKLPGEASDEVSHKQPQVVGPAQPPMAYNQQQVQ